MRSRRSSDCRIRCIFDRWLGKGDEEDLGASVDIPFEFVGEVARAGAMAEARDVESGTSARHEDEVLK